MTQMIGEGYRRREMCCLIRKQMSDRNVLHSKSKNTIVMKNIILGFANSNNKEICPVVPVIQDKCSIHILILDSNQTQNTFISRERLVDSIK